MDSESDIKAEADAMGRAMMHAMENIEPGEVTYLNLANSAGEAGLRIVHEVIDPKLLLAFRSVDGTSYDDGGGDCLFTSTYVMAALHERGLSPAFRLCTGYFDIPDEAPNRIIHAWLETFPKLPDPIVINVSNPKFRPVYSMNRSSYFRINYMKKRIETFTGKDFTAAVNRYIKKHGEDVDVRELTKFLLKKTRQALSREMKAVERRAKRSSKA